MDFYKNEKNLNRLRMVLIGAFVILLAFHFYQILKGQSDSYLSLFPPVFFVLLLASQVYKYKKGQSRQENGDNK